MLIQEVVTDLPAEEIIRRAREFFTLRFSPYASFVEEAGPSHVRFGTESGDLTVGVGMREGVQVVRGSTSRLHHELSQFLVTLGTPEEVRDNVTAGPGTSGAG
jgi:hypothetical protein